MSESNYIAIRAPPSTVSRRQNLRVRECLTHMDMYYDKPTEAYSLNFNDIESKASKVRRVYPCAVAGVKSKVLDD